ncbi:MAG: VCBS repeat-containing protein [Deltaproteobacteria bacterium]|nr:MAG: VCBS repeat-containing protein [Deltaproteobacteria bacterium]
MARSPTARCRSAYVLGCVLCFGVGCRDDPPPSEGTTGGTTVGSGTGVSTTSVGSTGPTPDMGATTGTTSTTGTTTGPDVKCGDGVPGENFCFAPRKIVDPDVVVADLAVSDFDGDGLGDGLVAAADGFRVVWAEGAGAIAFEPGVLGTPAVAVAAMPPRNMAQRAAVAYEQPPRVIVHASDPTRVVGFQATIALMRDAAAVAGADVTGDGDTDVLVAEAGTDADVVWAAAQPGGAFASLEILWTGAAFGDLASGLLGNDLFDDVAFTDRAAGRLLVGRNDGGGMLDVADQGAPGTPMGVAVGDVTADGFADVLVADASGGRLVLFRGRSDGTVRPPETLAAMAGARHVAVADLDGDGDLDAAVAGTGSGSVYAYRYDPDEDALSFAAEIAEVPTGVAALAAGEMTGDGVADLLVAGAGLPGLWFVRSNP